MGRRRLSSTTKKTRARGGRGPSLPAKRRVATGPARCKEPWSLYVVECADLSLYVGIAKNVDARLAVHNAGRGARYTRTRLPVRLLYMVRLPDVGTALRREREVKRWSRPTKVQTLGLPVAERLRAPRMSA